MRLRAPLFICFLIIFVATTTFAAPNEILIDEDFNSRDFINNKKTNAVVDITKGEVRLPYVSGSQLLDANNDATVIFNNGSLEFYSTDETGNYFLNPYLTHTISGNPIAAVLSPQGLDHYVLNTDGIVTMYKFQEGSLIADPAYQLGGFTSALSIARSEETLFVLDNREVRAFKDTGDGFVEIPPLNVLLDMDNPIQISVLDEDLVILDGNGSVHYYRYMDSFYIRDPAMDIVGSGTAIDSVSGYISSVRQGSIDQYNYTGTEMIKNDYISFIHGGVVSLASLEDGSVLVRDANGVMRYDFNGIGMVPSANISGLSSAPSGFLSPRMIETMEYHWSEETKRIFLDVVELLPDGTNTKYYVSSDGGKSFIEVDNSRIVQFVEPITKLIIKVELSTTIQVATPIIDRIRVWDKSLNIEYLETTRIVREPEGNPPLPTRNPVNVIGGYNFDMRVEAPGASNVIAVISNGDVIEMNYQGNGIFTHTYHFKEYEIGAYDVNVIARDSLGNEVERLFPAHYLLTDNIMSNITIYDVR